MANLYKIKEEMLALVDPETGEITDVEAFEALDMKCDETIENLALWIKNLASDIEAYKAEKAEFDKKIERANRTLESVRNYLSNALAGEKFKTSKVSCTFRTATSVEISDVSLIPAEFLRQKDPEPNKTAIKNALAAGYDVCGAKLVTKQSMSVK